LRIESLDANLFSVTFTRYETTVSPFSSSTGMRYFPVLRSFAKALTLQEKNEAGNFVSFVAKRKSLPAARE
jgi:hypothetical protein